MKDLVLTTRHHDGFCMFNSHYTDSKVTNTPYGRDVTRGPSPVPGSLCRVYTQRGPNLYLYLLQQPLGELILPGLKGRIERLGLLRTGEALELVGNWGCELLQPDEQRIRSRLLRIGDILKIVLKTTPNTPDSTEKQTT